MHIATQQAMAIIRRRSKNRWELGDVLVFHCGPPGHDKSHDSSYEIYEEILEEARHEGEMSLSTTSLSKSRKLSYVFPPESRISNVSWSTHEAIGSPEMMKKVLDRIGNNRRSHGLMIEIRKQIEREENPHKLSDIYLKGIAFMRDLQERYMQEGFVVDEGETQPPMVAEFFHRLGDLCHEFGRVVDPKRSHIQAVD